MKLLLKQSLDIIRIKNITESKIVLEKGITFNKETDNQNEDLNTTFEAIEYETEKNIK